MKDEGNIGFAIGPHKATFFKRGGGSVTLRNISPEQVREVAWFLIPLGVVMLATAAELFFSHDLSKEYQGMVFGWALVAIVCGFGLRIWQLIMFASLAFGTSIVGEQGLSGLLSTQGAWVIAGLIITLLCTAAFAWRERIWLPLVAFLTGTTTALFTTEELFQRARLLELDEHIHFRLGITFLATGLAYLFALFILYCQAVAVQQERDNVLDDSITPYDHFAPP